MHRVAMNAATNPPNAASAVASALAGRSKTRANTVAANAKTANPKATSSTKATNSNSDSDSSVVDPSDITSSDFLTLLVSELKNQDPTQPTDPNAYITQLVGVNSLQQLIEINQGLTTIEPSADPTSGS